MAKGRWSLNDLRKIADSLPEIINKGKSKIETLTPEIQKTQESIKQKIKMERKNLESLTNQKGEQLKNYQQKIDEKFKNIRKKASQQSQEALRSTTKISQQLKEKATESQKLTKEKIDLVSQKIGSLKQDFMKMNTGQKKQKPKEQISDQSLNKNQEKPIENERKKINNYSKFSVSALTQSILQKSKQISKQKVYKNTLNTIKQTAQTIFQKMYWKIVFAFCLGMFIYGIASQIPRQVRIYLRDVSRDALGIKDSKTKKSRKDKGNDDQDDD